MSTCKNNEFSLVMNEVHLNKTKNIFKYLNLRSNIYEYLHLVHTRGILIPLINTIGNFNALQ